MAQRNGDYDVGCPTGKSGWGSERQAKAAMPKRSGARLRPYFCPDCHHWHLTSHADRGRRGSPGRRGGRR